MHGEGKVGRIARTMRLLLLVTSIAILAAGAALLYCLPPGLAHGFCRLRKRSPRKC